MQLYIYGILNVEGKPMPDMLTPWLNFAPQPLGLLEDKLQSTVLGLNLSSV